MDVFDLCDQIVVYFFQYFDFESFVGFLYVFQYVLVFVLFGMFFVEYDLVVGQVYVYDVCFDGVVGFVYFLCLFEGYGFFVELVEGNDVFDFGVDVYGDVFLVDKDYGVVDNVIMGD